MSYEHEWPLTVWPTRSEVERAIADVLAAAKLDNPVVSHEAWDSEELDLDAPPNGYPEGETLPARTTITLVFRVPVASAVDVALRLDPLAKRETYVRGLEPPRGTIDWAAAQLAGHVTVEGGTRSISPEGEALFTKRHDHYELAVDLVAPDDDDERQAHVRVYSNTYDNREAYGIAAVIATDLADRLEKLSAFS
jgi:hypothetical protein